MAFIPPADKCPKCDWPYKGFHICVIDKRTPAGRKHADEVLGKKKPKRVTSEAHKQAIAEAQRERHARLAHKDATERDKVIEIYTTTRTGIRKIGEQLGLPYHKVIRILHKARDEGILVMRAPGHNISKGAL